MSREIGHTVIAALWLIFAALVHKDKERFLNAILISSIFAATI